MFMLFCKSVHYLSRLAAGPSPSPERKKIQFGCQRRRAAQQKAELMEWPNWISRLRKGDAPGGRACGDKQVQLRYGQSCIAIRSTCTLRGGLTNG